MSDADDALVRATDSLIALYRSVERSTLDLPLISVMPILTFIWAFLRFYFFFLVGIFLIIPTNLVILIRNIFPGYWRYRPFFLTHVYYCWLWIWRGEAPTAPFIFLRPLLNVFMKGHFETRLRRLRLEILDRDELSDATRSALLGRVDAALERWKSPRFAALFYSVLVPAIMWLPGWYKQLIEFLGSLGIRMPTDVVANFISEEMSTNSLVVFGQLLLDISSQYLLPHSWLSAVFLLAEILTGYAFLVDRKASESTPRKEKYLMVLGCEYVKRL